MYRYMIAGIKQFTPYFAEMLTEKGHKVIILDKNSARCNDLAARYPFRVIHGDGTDPQVLNDAGIKRCDALFALTGSDATNFIICKIAKKRFYLPKTYAWLNNAYNEEAFSNLGVYKCFNIADLLAVEMENSIIEKNVETYIRTSKIQDLIKKLYRKAKVAEDRKKHESLPQKQKLEGLRQGYVEVAELLEDMLNVKVFIHRE